MKKIICLLIALVTVLAMVSCGEQCETCQDSNGDGKCDVCGFDYEHPSVAIFKMVAEAEPTTIKTVTEASIDGVAYIGVYDTVIYSADHFVYNFEQQLPVSTTEDTDETVLTKTGELVYKDGVYTMDGVAVSGAPDVAYLDIKREITAANIAEFTVDSTGRELTAKLNSETCDKIFGIKPVAESITLTLKTNGTRLSQIILTYTDANGVVVTTQTSYSYTPVSSEA